MLLGLVKSGDLCARTFLAMLISPYKTLIMFAMAIIHGFENHVNRFRILFSDILLIIFVHIAVDIRFL